MRVFSLLCVLFHFAISNIYAQPTIINQKSFGGSGFDQSVSLIKSSGGGYLIGATSTSNISGEKSENGYGGEDFWLIKTDNNGAKVFDKTFGGSGVDQIRTIIELSNGELLICGTSFSAVSGNKTAPQFGNADYWVIKTDASGNLIWNKTFGGINYDELYGAVLSADGNIFLGGVSNSDVSGNKTSAVKGADDYWLVKINMNGDLLWDKTFGTTSFDFMIDLVATPDGGAILGGQSDGNAEFDKSEYSKGLLDCWLLKIDGSGNKVWDKTIGGNANEQFQKMAITPDGSLVVAASSESSANGNKTENSRGTWDIWAFKLNASGTLVWDKTMGGASEDFSRNINITATGDILLAGYSSSNTSGEKTEITRGGIDYWLLKLRPDGSLIWDKTIGGTRDDYGTNVLTFSNSKLIVVGTSSSGKTADKATITRGNVDVWILLLQETSKKETEQKSKLYPTIISDYK